MCVCVCVAVCILVFSRGCSLRFRYFFSFQLSMYDVISHDIMLWHHYAKKKVLTTLVLQLKKIIVVFPSELINKWPWWWKCCISNYRVKYNKNGWISFSVQLYLWTKRGSGLDPVVIQSRWVWTMNVTWIVQNCAVLVNLPTATVYPQRPHAFRIMCVSSHLVPPNTTMAFSVALTRRSQPLYWVKGRTPSELLLPFYHVDPVCPMSSDLPRQHWSDRSYQTTSPPSVSLGCFLTC